MAGNFRGPHIGAGHDCILDVLRQFLFDMPLLMTCSAMCRPMVTSLYMRHRRYDIDVGISFQGMTDVFGRFRRLELQHLIDIPGRL